MGGSLSRKRPNFVSFEMNCTIKPYDGGIDRLVEYKRTKQYYM